MFKYLHLRICIDICIAKPFVAYSYTMRNCANIHISHLCSIPLYAFLPSILLDLYFRFRVRGGTSTDGSALVGLTAPTPDAVQMRVSAWVQGSARVSYSSALWTETERAKPRLHITDWTIWHDIELQVPFLALTSEGCILTKKLDRNT